ncbi:bifunctional lysylphosphatidylglycerol flippase/synthetase MprF [Amycolatopsis suaedae]|nr:DUF2156 domain-containing protein [Amycolatopsis suaedae]
MMVTKLLRRYPFTVGGLAMIVVVGLVFGTFTTAVEDKPWSEAVTYGLPAVIEGRWWTILTGLPFAITPLCYIAVLGSFAAFVGFAEHRIGTGRTVVAWALGHVVGVTGALLVLLAVDGPLADAGDVGPSAGTMAVAAIVTATLAPRARLVIRIGLLAYVVGSILIIGSLADLLHLVAVVAGLPLGSLFTRRARPPADADRALDLLRRHGGGTLSWMTTWPGAEYVFAAAGDGFLAYRRHAGVAIALGDPVGSAGWRRAAHAEFTAHCRREGLVPCWFSVGEATADAVGTRRVQVAEDTLIDLPELAFRGKKWQDIRTARNRAAKEGIEFRMVTLADADPSVIAQVRQISASWLKSKHTPELRFTLGGVDEAMDPRVRVGIAVDADGTVHGVTSWLPILDETGHPRGWTLDLMRRREDGFRPVIEFLIAESCLLFQAEGAQVVSLSGAPLVRTAGGPAGLLQRGLDLGGRLMEPLYGFGSLHAFKAKFQPRREPLFLVYRHAADLPRIGAAITAAYLAKPTVARRLAQPVHSGATTAPAAAMPSATTRSQVKPAVAANHRPAELITVT